MDKIMINQSNLRSVIWCALMLLAAVIEASAHEKWFHETHNYGLRWDLLFRPLPLFFIDVVLLTTFVTWLYWRKRGGGFVPDPENFGTTDDRRAALYGKFS